MPTNRTRPARSWALDLDEHKREALLFGPDAMLLAGLGYWRLVDRSATLEEMRRDWRIHREALLVHWRGLPSRPEGLPRPWAAQQLDEWA